MPLKRYSVKFKPQYVLVLIILSIVNSLLCLNLYRKEKIEYNDEFYNQISNATKNIDIILDIEDMKDKSFPNQLSKIHYALNNALSFVYSRKLCETHIEIREDVCKSLEESMRIIREQQKVFSEENVVYKDKLDEVKNLTKIACKHKDMLIYYPNVSIIDSLTQSLLTFLFLTLIYVAAFFIQENN